MSETCRLRRGEGYGACDDEVVSKCALRDKKEGRSGFPERPRRSHRNAHNKKSSSFVRSISAAAG